MRRLRVAVDGRFRPGTAGGVETVAMGLAQGLAAVTPADIDVAFVTYTGMNQWIRPYVGGRVRVFEVPPPGRRAALRRRSRVWAVRPAAGSFGVLPARDRVLADLGADVVHIPFQGRGWVPQPSIYHPHDLQHRHLPEFFTPRQRAWREVVYRTNCRRASVVAVGTTWVKDDLARQFQIDPEKISVVPLAPIAVGRGADVEVDPVPRDLPQRYVAYPAAAWAHKNHRTLFKALSLLRRRGVSVPLVLTGSREVGVDLRAVTSESGVADLVHDLGYVSQSHVDAVVRKAVALVVPSRFEAASFPVWEAMRLGTPVACSNVTSLPRQVGDAGLIFDPGCATSIAAAIQRLWLDADLRTQLSHRGYSRVSAFTWERTARHFLALYRLLGERPLSKEDEAILSAGPGM